MSCRPVLACKSLVSTFDSTTFSSGLCRKIVAGFGFLSWKFPTWSPSLFGWNDWGTKSHCWCQQYQPSPLLQTCWAPVQRLQFFVASPLQDLFTNSDIVKNKSNRTGKKGSSLKTKFPPFLLYNLIIMFFYSEQLTPFHWKIAYFCKVKVSIMEWDWAQQTCQK